MTGDQELTRVLRLDYVEDFAAGTRVVEISHEQVDTLEAWARLSGLQVEWRPVHPYGLVVERQEWRALMTQLQQILQIPISGGDVRALALLRAAVARLEGRIAMTGDRQDAIATHLLTTAQGVTLAAGYDVPEDFRLVTDEILMWDQTGGRYPALIVQVEGDQSEPSGFSYAFEGRLPFRYIVYFQVAPMIEPATVTAIRAAHYARRYVVALRRGYMQDITRGGLADSTDPDDTPLPLAWRDNGQGTIFEATVRGLVIYEFDIRLA